jgi:hypothetical protein
MNARMTRRETLSLLAVLGVPASAVAASEQKGSGLTSRVTFENARVRVLEYVSAGGAEACGSGRHFHPAHLTIYLTPVRIRGRKDDGTTVVSDRKEGEVAWFEAGWHASENVGPAGARLCMVELKDKDWKPSTG